MTKTYTVKAIGVKLYREKTFATYEEAKKYATNLMGWYQKNRPMKDAAATMWYPTEDGKTRKIYF